MAFESRFWRAQIKRDINYISKRLKINLAKLEGEKLDQVFSEVEIKLFTIMYSLRKLMDTDRLPDKVSLHEINVSVFFRNKKKRINPWSLFDDYYNLEKKAEKRKETLKKICNQFIHAYFFHPVGSSKSNLEEIFFVSDWDKEKYLYSVNIKYLLRQIKKVIDEYPDSIQHTYNQKKNKWETVLK